MKLRLRSTYVAGAFAVAACAALGGMLSHRLVPPIPAALRPIREPSTDPAARAPLDQRAFAAKLWNQPARQPDPAPSAAAKIDPPKPLNLQLIGIIIDEAGVRKAAIYDPDADRTLIVSGGDAVRDFQVISITATGIELSDGSAVRRMALMERSS